MTCMHDVRAFRFMIDAISTIVAGRLSRRLGRAFSPRRAERAGAIVLAAVALPVAIGCASGSAASNAADTRAEGRAVFAQPGTNTSAQTPSGESSGWGVLLARASSPGHATRARQQLAVLQQLFPGDTLRVVSDDDGSAVLLGSFESPSDPAARTALERVKATTNAEGAAIFRSAFLVPPPVPASAPGVRATWELSTAAANAGRDVRYTLQIETYDDASRDRRAAAAEERVRDLRAEGEEAYFFHGPRFSIVTLGLFGPDDYDETVDRASPRLERLQQRFPRALLNGSSFRFGGSEREINSFLILLPESDQPGR